MNYLNYITKDNIFSVEYIKNLYIKSRKFPLPKFAFSEFPEEENLMKSIKR